MKLRLQGLLDSDVTRAMVAIAWAAFLIGACLGVLVGVALGLAGTQ